jgi:isoleucyl-tRNA synthetase
LGIHCQFGERDKLEEVLISSVEELYNEIEKSIAAGFQKRKSF